MIRFGDRFPIRRDELVEFVELNLLLNICLESSLSG